MDLQLLPGSLGTPGSWFCHPFISLAQPQRGHSANLPCWHAGGTFCPLLSPCTATATCPCSPAARDTPPPLSISHRSPFCLSRGEEEVVCSCAQPGFTLEPTPHPGKESGTNPWHCGYGEDGGCFHWENREEMMDFGCKGGWRQNKIPVSPITCLLCAPRCPRQGYWAASLSFLG